MLIVQVVLQLLASSLVWQAVLTCIQAVVSASLLECNLRVGFKRLHYDTSQSFTLGACGVQVCRQQVWQSPELLWAPTLHP